MTPREPDHDRLVRIEEVLQGLSDKLIVHTEELRAHIRDETADFSELKQKLTLHLRESEVMMHDVDVLKSDVGQLKIERMRLIGWLAGVIFVTGLGWMLFDSWLDHSNFVTQSQHEKRP